MIAFHSVGKLLSYQGSKTIILDQVDWLISRRAKIAILGQSGSGKSTLLDLVSGVQCPTAGWVERRATVSPTTGLVRYASSKTSPRQLARRLATLYHADPAQLMNFIEVVGDLHDALDTPVRELRRHDRLNLSLALFYGLPFDFYLFDERISVGSAAMKDRCRAVFNERRQHAGMILATSLPQVARRFGGAGAHLHRGKLTVFPTVAEAIDVFQRTSDIDPITATSQFRHSAPAEDPIDDDDLEL